MLFVVQVAVLLAVLVEGGLGKADDSLWTLRAGCNMTLHGTGEYIGKVQFMTNKETGLHGHSIDLRLKTYKTTYAEHGFHVHSNPVSGFDCKSAGGHYNPNSMPHGGLTSKERHVGDFGNVWAYRGRIRKSHKIYNYKKVHKFDMFSLEGGQSIIGRGVVLHAGEDDLGQGGDEGSRTTGNAGARLACCTLEKLDI